MGAEGQGAQDKGRGPRVEEHKHLISKSIFPMYGVLTWLVLVEIP